MQATVAVEQTCDFAVQLLASWSMMDVVAAMDAALATGADRRIVDSEAAGSSDDMVNVECFFD